MSLITVPFLEHYRYKRDSFIVCLTCHSDIDHDVSIASCRSLLGYSVDLLGGTISTTVVFSDWSITNLAQVGSGGFRFRN